MTDVFIFRNLIPQNFGRTHGRALYKTHRLPRAVRLPADESILTLIKCAPVCWTIEEFA